ncbi:MAG: transporter [Verrucomicrobia bacterium]|nr:transporter [Verrucomicrobiota bacterium]MDA1006662.1 transporter [Verrucomicrobiota bacterium]
MNQLHSTALLLALTATAFAGPDELVSIPPLEPSPTGFENARRPISNPTRFDLALPRTNIHALWMHHNFPNHINRAGGGTLPFGGDLDLFAVQLEYAFNDRLSLVANKDGYIDFNPDNTFSSETGFANLAAGLKYAFIFDPDKQFVLSGSAVVEVPTGNRDVFQGEGDGSLHLSLSDLKLYNQWQFAGAAGVEIPFDNDFSTTGFISAHVSYEVCNWFIPLVELNWFTVLDEGDGGSRFASQAGGAVPAVASFEGADLINWGAANGGDHDYATAAFGFRSRLSETLDLGFAYEIPLTDENDNITENRLTVDLTLTF